MSGRGLVRLAALGVVSGLVLACGGFVETIKEKAGGLSATETTDDASVSPGATGLRPPAPGEMPGGVPGTNIDPDARNVDVLTTANGAVLVGFQDGTSALVDSEVLAAGWRLNEGKSAITLAPQGSAERYAVPVSWTFELPQIYRLDRVGVTTVQRFEGYPDKLKVEVSLQGPTQGFVPVGDFTLEAGASQQAFSIPATEARWVRYTLPSCAPLDPAKTLDPSQRCSEMHDWVAFGERASDMTATPVDLTGTWKTWKPGTHDETTACFRQEGASVRGILLDGGDYRPLDLRGFVQNRVLNYQTTRAGGDRKAWPDGTTGGLVIDAEGDRMVGAVATQASAPTDYDSVAWFEKTSDRVTCEGLDQVASTEAGGAAVPRLEAELQAGSATLYGVLFQPDSDVILDEPSKPTLDALTAQLQAHPTWKLEVVGYTDDTGDEAARQPLSQRQAQSVATWLTSEGIDASRLVVSGKGSDDPVASNETPSGRALNRRVEVHRMGAPVVAATASSATTATGSTGTTASTGSTGSSARSGSATKSSTSTTTTATTTTAQTTTATKSTASKPADDEDEDLPDDVDLGTRGSSSSRTPTTRGAPRTTTTTTTATTTTTKKEDTKPKDSTTDSTKSTEKKGPTRRGD